jgi:hypothetical protein
MRTRGASLSGLPKLEQCIIFSIDKNRSRDYDIFRGVRANGFFLPIATSTFVEDYLYIFTFTYNNK